MKKSMFKLFVTVLISMMATSAVAGDKVSAYLLAPFQDVSSASKALEKANFEVLSTYESSHDGITIVFTNDELKKAASKDKRGFASVLRLLVNSDVDCKNDDLCKREDKNRVISIDNPVYFLKAFLQDDYNEGLATSITASLKSALSPKADFKLSSDALDDDDLAGYHFMMGMPYYEDMEELAEADNAKLLRAVKKYKKGKNLLFSLKVGESTLVGYALSSRTSKFVRKIGIDKAQVLPYTILITDGKAYALAPKYYLAISYPLLSMGDFMTISTVPGAIIKELKKPFKKLK
ncbi:MAG: hypothetical protein GQ570_01120 [Helicobacteraceae bacterium]|nr:hypothetical protein [Helicobacteraceae bacterium]